MCIWHHKHYKHSLVKFWKISQRQLENFDLEFEIIKMKKKRVKARNVILILRENRSLADFRYFIGM